jgi:acetate---CoA ligase (ADP-forming)
MAAYPSDFEFDVLLKDGEVTHLRPIRPDDAEREQRFFKRVGAESAYFRFFRAKHELSPEELRFFTNVDYDDRMAFIALDGDEMVAVGRYDVIPGEAAPDGGRVAEVAFLVQDDYQGRGIGSHLLQHLTVYARLKGITEFEAYVMAENHSMLRLFRASGYGVTRQLNEGVYRIEFPIEYSLEAQEAEWEHEKRSVSASLLPILYPTSIAVIGASRDEASIGGRLLRNILNRGFAGPVYPVNPNAPFVNSVRAYPSVLDIADPIDLAFVVVPAPLAQTVLEECGEKGVRGVVVISAGFAETGEEGAEMERALLSTARRHGMRMVGPNGMGVVNTDPAVSLDGQFGPTFPPTGNVAMGSQSGALGLAILEQAAELSLGISTFVSLGNHADVNANDLLLYWEGDPATDVILLYVESFGNPRRFGRIARRVSRNKPIVVVKAGRSTAGARAAGSHTGSLASLDVAVDALFRQSGVIRTDTLDELFEVTALLSHQPLPGGRRIAVLSNAGGPAILAADALENQGLELPTLSDALQERLRGHLLTTASTTNPVDMVASAGPQEYELSLRYLAESDEIDSVIVIHIPTTPGGSEDVAAAISRALEPVQDKTIAAVMMGGARAEGTLTAEPPYVPVYAYPESAARALAAAADYAEWRTGPESEYVVPPGIDRVEGEAVVRAALARTGGAGGWLDEAERARLFAAYDIELARSEVVTSEDEAVAATERLGTVAIKVISPTAVHKSDVGGVVLGVSDPEAARAAYRQVTSAVDDAEGAVVQALVEEGHEVIVGMTEDPTFGPLIVFGLGGVYVELLQDVSFRINPLSVADAHDMIGEVRSAQILTGYRGGPAGDTGALEDLLLRVSAMVQDLPEIAEMDLNPVKVLPPGRGICVIDARVHVRPVEGAFLPSRKDIPGRMQ